MVKVVEGIYRGGKIELVEVPSGVQEETRVLVTFIESGPIDLASRGIDKVSADEMRARLATFADDWDSPEMDVYDDYDAAKSQL